MEEQLDGLGATKQPLKWTPQKKRNLSVSDNKKRFFEYPPVGFHRMQIDLVQADKSHIKRQYKLQLCFNKQSISLRFWLSAVHLNIIIYKSRKRMYYSVCVWCLEKSLEQLTFWGYQQSTLWKPVCWYLQINMCKCSISSWYLASWKQQTQKAHNLNFKRQTCKPGSTSSVTFLTAVKTGLRSRR